MTDYYEILGVPRDATPEQVKRAYRKVARLCHPDVAKDGGDTERFKEATRAYEVLSNPEKRQMYDQGVDPTRSGAGQQPFGGAGFDFQDIFETFFGAAGPAAHGPTSRSRRGQDALLRVEIELVDAVFGTEREIVVDTAITCTVCEGSCSQAGSTPQMCPTCHGAGVVQQIAHSFLGQVMTSSACPQCRGYGNLITNPCPECSGEGRVRARRTITVRVPAGVETGSRIRLAGQGEAGPAGGPAGDLLVDVLVQSHEVFTRDGDDLHATASLPMSAAALGTTITIDTFDGPTDVDVLPGTHPGAVAKLRGKGVGRLRRSGRGDLHIHLDVQTPTDLDDEQRQLLERLAELRGETSPEGRLSQSQPGFFQRMRDKFTGK